MSQPSAKMGRPRKEFSWQTFEQLCKLQCTKAEIIGFFHVSKDTLDRRIKEITGETFEVIYGELSQGGKVSLRRAQMRSALGDEKTNPSVQMQIWLGKQMLDQSDKVKQEVDDKRPFEFKSNPK